MQTLLRLDSSLFSNNGVSSQLSDELVEKLQQKYPELEVVQKDFAKTPIPHQDASYIQAISTSAEERTDEMKEKAAFSDGLIKEVQDADAIVIGLPMYNFGVPSMLKAWFDHIARAGTTFQYTENGPVGLLKGKKVYLVTTRGGFHKDAPTDTQIPFVKTFLNFVGLDDVEIIYAEGLNLGEDSREKGIETAKAQIDTIAA